MRGLPTLILALLLSLAPLNAIAEESNENTGSDGDDVVALATTTHEDEALIAELELLELLGLLENMNALASMEDTE